MPNSLIDFWSEFKPKRGTLNVHHEDLDWFEDHKHEVLEQELVKTFANFLNSDRFGMKIDRKLHLSLLPSPFHGDIRKANIFILLMNPGFIASDYYAEENSDFWRASIANLTQRNIDPEFPYFSLNPKFAWSGAYQWIEARMRPILLEIQQKHRCSYYEALSKLSKQLAVIQLFPYHSSDGHAIPGRCWRELPSVKAARQFVKEELSRSPKHPLIIVARSHNRWGVPEGQRNVISSGRTRGVTFNPQLKDDAGDAGKAILKKLGLR